MAKAASKPVKVLISLLFIIFVSLQTRNTFIANNLFYYSGYNWQQTPDILLHLNKTIDQTASDIFCHSESGISHREYSNASVTYRHCFGYCRHKNPNITTFLPHAVEAPRISALCSDNPFHGFYDCIWPLVHYLTTCAALQQWRGQPTIITNNAVLSERRGASWVVRAQEAYLNGRKQKGLQLEKNRVPGSQCICFNSLVQFDRNTFWRPTRYQFTYNSSDDTVISSHPVQTKRNGLVKFRDIVLARYKLNARPLDLHNPRVLIYGREDAPRRKWLNVASFTKALRSHLPTSVSIHSLKKIPKKFDEQVKEFNAASVLIAPHGAAMVNTLFMRRGSAVLEIGSRHCLRPRVERNASVLDTDTIANVSDPNAWVPWHAQSLGLIHMTAMCVVAGGGGDFEVEEEGLVQLAITSLLLTKTVVR